MTAGLTRSTGAAAKLRKLLDSGETILAPGAFDPLAGRCVEEAGFEAVYMTGFGTAAAVLGRPDVGLVTMTEMVDNAARIAACVDIPVIADADTGYGNPINFPGVPLLFNWAEGGKTPPIGLDRLCELGFRIVIFPISTLLAATGAMRSILAEIAAAGGRSQ